MNRRILAFLFAGFALSTMPTHGLAQNIVPPSTDELKATLQDDERFAQLMTEVWVLRDLLALQQGGDISTDTKEFQGLQDQVRTQRTSIVDAISGEPTRARLSDDVLTFANNVGASLGNFGVRPDSDLGKRLISANLMFNQALSAASLGSLCSVHPFRILCASE